MQSCISTAATAEGSLSSAVFEPDLEEARRFLDLLDPGGLFVFQTFKESESATGAARYPKILHGTLDEHADTLSSINQQGGGIFMMVNAGDGKGRKAKNVVRVRAVFVDLDGSPLEPVTASAPHPSIVVNSSPGRWHAYWLVSDYPLDEFSAKQQQLIAKFNSDPSVHDLPRVMRLPGFFHCKAEPFMSRVIYPDRSKQ